MTFDLLIRIADRLSQVSTGSPEADRAIHDAFGRDGPVLPFTREEQVARLLLPAGFEWRDPVHSPKAVYASCRRVGLDGGFPYPHHGQWSQTPALAMSGAVLRVRAAEVRDV